jgi:hypothetical protein
VKETSEGFIPVAFCFLKNYSDFYTYKERRNQQPLMTKKRAGTEKSSTAWDFPLYFQLPYLPEETGFQQAGYSAVEGTSQPFTISKK